MRNSKQETIADIVAAMRNEGHAGNASCLEWVSGSELNEDNLCVDCEEAEAAANKEGDNE